MNIEQKKELLSYLLSVQLDDLKENEQLTEDERNLYILLGSFVANDHKEKEISELAKDIMVLANKKVSPNLYALAYIASVIIINICVVCDVKSSDDDVLKMASVIFIMGSCLAGLGTILIPRTHEVNAIIKKELLNSITWRQSMGEQINVIFNAANDIKNKLSEQLKQALVA